MKKIFIIGILAVLSAALPVVAYSQAKLVTIQGTVTDEKGEPLPGASVIVENTNQGQITDVDGKYTIKTFSDKALVYSFIGYKSQTILARANRTLNVDRKSVV